MARRDRAEYNAYMAEYMRNRYELLRAQVITYLGGRCFVCGRTDTLQIDHIDPETKQYDLGKLTSLSKAKLWAEVEKCQLLCADHHRDKSRVDMNKKRGSRITLEHGTLGMRRYCSCDLCKEASRQYMRDWRARKKEERQRLRS